jgi:hypothetical protein
MFRMPDGHQTHSREWETFWPVSPFSTRMRLGLTSSSCRIRVTEPDAPARDGQGEICRSASSVSILLLEARMADVVRLKEWLARTPRRDTSRREAPAQVLLFTGVRYERLTPAMLAARRKAVKTGAPDTVRRP